MPSPNAMSTISLTFLHTADVHVETFENLVTAQDAGTKAEHHVNTKLLEDARQLGADNPEVIKAVQAEVAQLSNDGASLVVCTCSTIGGIVESLSNNDSYTPQIRTQRIDRAMADAAVELHSNKAITTKIVVVAALESTLGPTQALIESSAKAKGRTIDLSLHHIQEAWQYFEAGDDKSYWKSIAYHLKRLPKADVIVLAQASMANAVNFCSNMQTPILSSPSLGVAAALKTLKQ